MADSINPSGSKSISADLLPRYYRSDSNKKFLQATVDQLIQPGTVKKINGYIGKQNAKSAIGSDIYISAPNQTRQDYQLEPSLVIKDTLGNTTFFKDYQDYINQLKVFGADTSNHSRLNSQEMYSWDPHIDWDKFVNFQNYYWLPYGPDTIKITGQQQSIVSTFTVSIKAEADSNTYVFFPNSGNQVENPSIKLYRGQTYRFEVSSPGNPFSIKVQRTAGTTERYDVPGLVGNATENGVIELTIPYNSPDILYYVSETDVNLGGVFEVLSIDENTSLDVENEILGKKSYTLADGTQLTNGMKVSFVGQVMPASYASGQYYVEGVGSAIRLINESILELISAYTKSESILFDATPFDSMPFSDATSFAEVKDYVVINRGSYDHNPWSRYNRWFHKDVIDASAAYNGKVPTVDQTARAVRPIIEFEANIRLNNFGVEAIPDVDLVDTFTTDMFSKVEGQLGYNVDGIDLAQGQRILVTADTDIRVKNRIFQVEFLILNGVRQIHLVDQGEPIKDQVVLVKQGLKNQGLMYWYTGAVWQTAQQKTKVNQAPLFDIVDTNGNSYSDKTMYDGSTFIGTKLFSYKIGTGTADTTLGFPLSYKNINNVGDIVFNFNIATDTFQYKDVNNIVTGNTNVGYLIKTLPTKDTAYVNGWQKCTSATVQAGVRIYKNTNRTNNFDIDIYDDVSNLDDLVVHVYVNGIRVPQTWSIVTGPIYKQVVLATDITTADVLTIRAFAAQPINSNGYYEVPANLQNNPLNQSMQDFTLGEVINHVDSIVDNIPGIQFVGSFPGVSNLRDLGNVTQYGTRFVQHSGPVSLSLYHTTSETNNVVRAIEKARDDYNRFKRNFIAIAESLGVNSDPVNQVNLILQEINKDKPKTFPYYFSDMAAYSGSIRTDLSVIDYRIKTYPLTNVFNLDTLSNQAVLVYLNDEQLLYKKDYTFNDQGFIVVLATIANDDVITIYEFENTNGCFIPQTPTKLGIWPKYEPKKYWDTSLVTPRWMLQGHDGSQVLAYEDYRDDLILELEKRIYNNIKVQYNTDIFDVNDFVPGYTRKTDYSLAEFNNVLSTNFYTWASLVDRDFTKPLSYDRDNSLTFNYRNLATPDGASPLPGYWKGIYRWLLDTDRPNICPWEMLGFSEEPSWWVDLYGPAPYTSDNLVLWDDLSNGLVREPGKPQLQLSKYIRPYLKKHIPVDANGNIVSPLVSGLATGVITNSTAGDFLFGDGSPVESAWRRSSHYPFSALITFMLLKPSKTFGTLLDRSRIVRNLAGQLIYKDTGLRITPQDIVLPSIYSSTTNVKTSGIINYIVDYILSDNLKSYSQYASDLATITAQLSYRVSGFTSKEKFNLLLDSKTPLTSGSVFVPQEDYNIILNTSSPVKKINYSGVIVTKFADGFGVKGYSRTQPYFKYYPFSRTGTPINVGGISESYTTWAVRSQYAAGKIVAFANRYYRVKTLHTTTDVFNPVYYDLLAALPIVGGVDAFIRQAWDKDEVITVPYGTKFRTVQEVVDFLLGYGEWLKDEGFIFDDFNTELNAVTNWETSAKEFLFWTTQNWSTGQDKWDDWVPDQQVFGNSIVRYNGDFYQAMRNSGPSLTFEADDYIKLDGLSSVGSSVISLSPAAAKLTFSTPLCVVDDIRNPFNNYEIFKVDGTPIAPNFLNNYREDNTVSYTPMDDGIFGATFYLVQKEQVVVLNNSTLFNDTIYNPESGYRQERIKVAGYVSSGWKGDFNIPGFIFDQAIISEWEAWKDYALGDIVKYKQFYYTSKSFAVGKQTFDSNDWTKLDKKPEAQLLPNWTYKASQFEDFYSLDSDNFDASQQQVAQHLIGYQKRQYLENIIQDDVSEFKFYQGMIVEKGTQNVLNKLFDVLSAEGKESITFFEEWALRVGQYGASSSFENIEFVIDEELFKNNPQGFELVNSANPIASDFIIRQTPNDVYLKPLGYSNNPWPTLGEYVPYLRTPGYVRSSDVKLTLKSLDEIYTADVTTFLDGNYVWVGFEGREWNVYRYTNLNSTIVNVEYSGNSLTITLEENATVSPGDVIGLDQADDYTGFYNVTSVSLTKIHAAASFKTQPKPFTSQLRATLATLISHRVPTIDDAQLSVINDGELLWTDNAGDNKWATWQYKPAYEVSEITNSAPKNGLAYGRKILLNTTGNLSAISTNAGDVIVYDKASPVSPWLQRQTITAPFISTNTGFGNTPTPDSLTGDVLALSADSQWLATGTPDASSVCSHYSGLWNSGITYGAGDIVIRNGLPYQALINSLNQDPLSTVHTYTNVVGNTITGNGVGATFNVTATNFSYSASVVNAGNNYAVGDTIRIFGTVLGGTAPTNNIILTVVSIVNGAPTGPLAGFTVSGNARIYWLSIPYIPVDSTGSNNNGFAKQGVVSIYKKDANNIFSLVATVLSPLPTANERFGSSLVFGDNELFVGASGNNNGTGIVYRLSYSTVVETSTSYNPIGSAGTTVVVSSTAGISVGQYLQNAAFTSNQYVAQVNTSASSVIISAAPDSSPTGTISFVTTNWRYNIANTLVEALPVNSIYGYTMAQSVDNTTLLVSAPGSVTSGKVFVYVKTDGMYDLVQTITGTETKFGNGITISKTADYLAISSVLSDGAKIDQGAVTVYKRVNGQYVVEQQLSNPYPEVAEFFGTKIQFMNDFQTLVVYSQGADNFTKTMFDSGATSFDNNLTKIKDRTEDSGRIDIYDRYNTKWIFSESLANPGDINTGYSTGLATGENQILVGAPFALDNGTLSGRVYSYLKQPGTLSWNILHKENNRVDLNKIKRAFLYNKVTNKLVSYLDVIDSTQGKIPGIADQEIKYKTFYDPATYSSGTSDVNVDDGMAWTKPYVGTLWWDLRTAKFFDSHDESLIYRNSTWNTIFPGASIDVYEWVETKLTPDQWNALADTEEGITAGISGTSLYSNSVYSVVRKYDNVAKTFKNTYYYWVKNKKTIPASANRNMSAQDVVDLIENPRGYGYRYIALTGSNSFSLVNVKPLLEDKDVVLSVEYWTSTTTDKNIHSEWKLINNNIETTLPAAIEQKWFDSLCGKDVSGRVVPDPALPAKLKYGVEVRPRQGMFVNRFEALKQFIEEANRVLINQLIVENRDISTLDSYEAEPSTITGLYDSVIDTDAELRFANIGTYGKPQLSPIIVDGRITGIDIVQRGSGYLIAPYFTITGTGTGAVVKAIIDVRGQITGATIVSSGHGYDDNTIVTVRNYSVLVRSDSVAGGSWSIYAYEPSTLVWSRVQSQSYDVRKYWSYADWYAIGYNEFTAVDFSVNSFVELNDIESSIGQLVKIRTTSLGTWALLEKYADSTSVDWTQSYRVVGRQRGTIQFATNLYDFADSPYGFDASLYDSGIFDNSAAIELRIILDSLKNKILIDTLKQSYLNLFFASVRYAYSEQNYIDWIFKTSFVKAQHSVGELKQKVTYNNDNLSNFEDYINEVKPYRTKIREYVSAYSKLEQTGISTTDFDVPPVYENGHLVPITTSIVDGLIQADNAKIIQYPWKHWYDNLGYQVTSLNIVDGGSDYVTLPTVHIISNTGTGATARAFITNGKVNRIVLLTKGSGYLSAPTIVIEGGKKDTGTQAKVVAVIGNGVVRSNVVKMKFDRISQQYLINDLTVVQNGATDPLFVGTGSRLQFPLTWAPDVRIGKSTVTVNGVEALRTSYTLKVVKSTSRGYTSYAGAITFNTAPVKGAIISVTYIKDWSVLTAADRIQHYYDPATGELGKDLAQLMTGVDYGGVSVHGLNFDIASGWGSVPYYSDKWASFDTTFDDYIVTVAANTHSFTLPYVPASGTEMNVYYSGKNSQSYNADGYTLVYNFNVYDIYPPVVTVSNTHTFAGTNLAGTAVITLSSVSGIKTGDIFTISPNVLQTVALDTKVIAINTLTNQVTLDQIIFKDITSTNAIFTRTLIDPTDCTINPNGTVVLVEPLVVGSTINITAYFAPVRLDDSHYNTTGVALQVLATKQAQLAVLVTEYNDLTDSKQVLENSLGNLNDDLYILQLELNSLNIILAGMSPSNPNYPSIVSQINILVNTSIPAIESQISAVESDLADVNDALDANAVATTAKQQEINVAQAVVDGLPPVQNITAIMQTIIADGTPDNLIDPTTKTFAIPGTFHVFEGDKFIWRKSSSDGSVKPQEADYDTALSGGTFLASNLTSATGLAADDIIVDGDGFVTAMTSPATEEVVPGQVVDAVAIKVYDRPTSGSANIKVDSYIADGIVDTFKITQQPNSPTAVVVKFTSGERDVNNELLSVSTVQTLTDDYTIDYKNSNVVFNTPPTAGKLVSIFSFGFNGSGILDLDYFIGDGSTTEFITKAPWLASATYLVYVNGLPAEPGTPALFKTDATYDSSNRFGLTFSVPPSAGALINYVIVSGSQQTYSITKTERIQGTGSDTYNLLYQVGDSLPAESNMLVRVGQRILKGPNNSYFTIKGTQVNYNIDPAKFLPYSLSVTDVIVYADGVLLKSGVDYIVELGGITVKITQLVRKTYLNKELVVSVKQGQEYSYIPGATPQIKFATTYSSADTIEVISSYKHDILNIQRTAVSITSNLTLTPDTPAYYNYKGLAGGTILLDRTVIDDNYVWVIKNGSLLTPSVDFKLNPDRKSIKLALYPSPADEFTIITYGSQVLENGISYMQFKDMLNRTHYKRLSAKKQTKLVKSLLYTDISIEVEDAGNFDAPSIANNKPGIIEIRGERIEFFTLSQSNAGTWLLGQLRRGTLGTGVPRVHKSGAYVQDIGASETIPYVETSVVEQIKSDGTSIVPLPFVPGLYEEKDAKTGVITSWPSDIEVFVGGYASLPWAPNIAYAVDDIVDIGSYTYRCVTAHTSGSTFSTDNWTFFVGNIRLKKKPYKVHNVNVHPESTEGDIELDAEFTVDGTSKQLVLTNLLGFGTRVTVIKRTLTEWDSTTSILNDDTKIARFLKAEPPIWYSTIGKYENKLGIPSSFDNTSGTFDSDSITFDQG